MATASQAVDSFGAIEGRGQGQQGQSYAIATLDESLRQMPLSSIQAQLYLLSEEAKENPDKEYLLTPIGTGIAGYSVNKIKSILPKTFPENVILVGNWK